MRIWGHQVSNRAGEKTEFGPGKTALYYNNNGLFSDPFLEDRLPNIEKYYNNPSTRFLNDYCNIDESNSTKYNEAFQRVMDLWNKLDQNVPKYCSKERQVQNTWIDPIFKILGWEIELEEASSKNGVTNFPDYALFASLEDWKKSKDLSGNNKFKKATAVADAKDWGVSLDGKGFSNKNPSFQIINYLKQTDKNWGILTDGKYWRIYSLRSDSKHTTFYEIDLEKILASGDYQRFKYFYNFFRVEAFVVDAKLNDRSFLDFVFEDGKFYSQLVEKNLQERVYKVANSICQGVLANYSNPSEQELKQIYENSMYYLFKLMFVLNCESKGLLEVNKQDDYYDFSLRKRCLEIKEQLEQGKNWSSQPKSYNYINDLFDLLKTGDQKIGVHGFGNEPFEIGNLIFFSKNKIGDDYLNTALLDLACDKDDEGSLQFIDYKILSPDHIGSLFEGLLEFSLIKSDKKFDLVNTKGERKATGSYYTPDYVVDYIVEETLKPEIENKNPSEILNMRVLDPAMGSGHFLLGVVKFLENTIVRLQNTESKVKGSIEFDKVRKEVLRNCVFGVDINPLATQLAKFSLWIYTSQKGDTLESLSDQLKCANSLLDSFKWKTEFPEASKNGGFSAIVMNPPYVGENDQKNIFDLLHEEKIWESHLGKMDYWYFFVHKSFEVLKDNGRLGFIATDYWRQNQGAKKLRVTLADKTIESYISFGEFKIFESAKGQHNMILICSNKTSSGVNKSYVLKKKISTDDMQETLISRNYKKVFDVVDLAIDGERFIEKGTKEEEAILSLLDSKNNLKLDDIATIGTGIQPGPDVLNKSGIARIGSANEKKYALSAGRGVFVVTKKELDQLALTKDEKTYCKAFVSAKELKNGDKIKWSNGKSIFYLTPSNCSSEKEIPNICNFLRPARLLMDERRETVNGARKWFHLHWPREESLFESQSIVAVRMCKEPIFALSEGGLYFDLSVNVIVPKNLKILKALFLYLQTDIINIWLKKRGKVKGGVLQVDGKPLREIPVPDFEKMTGPITLESVRDFSIKYFGGRAKEMRKTA